MILRPAPSPTAVFFGWLRKVAGALVKRSEECSQLPVPVLPAVAPVPAALDDRPLVLPLGRRLDRPGPFLIHEEALWRHLLCVGSTGSGKSFLVRLICDLLIGNYRGVCVLDPAGDLTEDLAVLIHRRAIATGCDAIRQRVHYLELTPASVFGWDLMRFTRDPNLSDALQANARVAWLHAEAHRIAKIVVACMGEDSLLGKPRLERLLIDSLVAVGTAVNRDGKHLPLSEILVLLNVRHSRHNEVYATVARFLPSEVRSDLQLLRALRDQPAKLFEQIEAPTNRIRNLMSPLVKAVFAETARSIPFEKILRERGVLLVNLRETRYFSPQQAQVIGALFFQRIRETAAMAERADRQRYYVVLEEASALIGTTGDGVRTALQQARKHKLSVCLLGQSKESFQRGPDDNTMPIIMNEVGSIIAMQQKAPDSRNLFADVLGITRRKFEPLCHEVDRPDGYEWQVVRAIADSQARQDSRQRTASRNEGLTLTDSASLALADQRTDGTAVSNSRALAHSTETGTTDSEQETTGEDHGRSSTTSVGETNQRMTGRVDQEAVGTAHQQGQAATESKMLQGGPCSSPDARLVSTSTGLTGSQTDTRTHTAGTTSSEAHSTNTQQSDGTTVTQKHSRTKGRATSESHGIAETDTEGQTANVSRTLGRTDTAARSAALNEGQGLSITEAIAATVGRTVTAQPTPLMAYRIELQETGQLRESVADQEAKDRKELATLGLAEAVVLLSGEKESFPVKVMDLTPVDADPVAFSAELRAFKEMNAAVHADYLFQPVLTPEAETARIDAYVGPREEDVSPPPEEEEGPTTKKPKRKSKGTGRNGNSSKQGDSIIDI